MIAVAVALLILIDVVAAAVVVAVISIVVDAVASIGTDVLIAEKLAVAVDLNYFGSAVDIAAFVIVVVINKMPVVPVD